jgi:hypothetical protein
MKMFQGFMFQISVFLKCLVGPHAKGHCRAAAIRCQNVRHENIQIWLQKTSDELNGSRNVLVGVDGSVRIATGYGLDVSEIESL